MATTLKYDLTVKYVPGRSKYSSIMYNGTCDGKPLVNSWSSGPGGTLTKIINQKSIVNWTTNVIEGKVKINDDVYEYSMEHFRHILKKDGKELYKNHNFLEGMIKCGFTVGGDDKLEFTDFKGTLNGLRYGCRNPNSVKSNSTKPKPDDKKPEPDPDPDTDPDEPIISIFPEPDDVW